MTCTYGDAGASTMSKSTKGHTQGKYYFEMKLNLDQVSQPDTWTSVGLVTKEAVDLFQPEEGYGKAYRLVDTWGDGIFRPAELHDGDIIGIAVDLNKGLLYANLNGNWKTGQPGTDNGIAIKTGLEYFAAASCSASSQSQYETDSWTAAFKEYDLQYPVPKGFSAYEY